MAWIAQRRSMKEHDYVFHKRYRATHRTLPPREASSREAKPFIIPQQRTLVSSKLSQSWYPVPYPRLHVKPHATATLASTLRPESIQPPPISSTATPSQPAGTARQYQQPCLCKLLPIPFPTHTKPAPE